MLSPTDLTLPAAGSQTLRAVLSAALRRAAKDLLALRDPALRPVLACVHRELKTEPGRVMAILRRPNVGAALRVLRRGPNGPLASQLAATLALELSAAGARLPALTFRDLPSRVVCLGGGFTVPGGRLVTLEGTTWTVDGQRTALRDTTDARHHAVAPGLWLSTYDDNPLAMDEAHPDKSGNAVDLGGQTPARWVASLTDALTRIGTYLPELREEATLALSQFIPVGYDEHAHLSASYAEALGTIYLSLHPDPMTMTEAVIHELSHNKLNALLESGDLLENAFHPLFSSPVRPDPRPLHGVLLAVHAFVPVEALYREMARADDPISRLPGFVRRRRTVMEKNRMGAGVLAEHAIATELGRGLLEEIAGLLAEADADD